VLCFDPSEPMMMKVWNRDRIEQMITKREFDALVEQRNQREAAKAEMGAGKPP